MNEPTMICTDEDAAAIHSLLTGCEAVVDEIRRLREDVLAANRGEKIDALTKEFDRRVEELTTYIKLISQPVTEEKE